MKSRRPPASVSTPFEFPRGAPSDSGLMKLKLIGPSRCNLCVTLCLCGEKTIFYHRDTEKPQRSHRGLNDLELVPARIAHIEAGRAGNWPWIGNDFYTRRTEPFLSRIKIGNREANMS